MKRIAANTSDCNCSLLKELTNQPPTNRKQLKIAQKALLDVIQNDLTPRQQECIYLHYYQQMRNTQIAQYLHLDKSTVSRTLKRARKQIYKSLHVYFDYVYLSQEDDDDES